VEDDEDLSTAVVRVARSVSSDIEVDWACSTDGARRLLRSRHYELVLADYFLEGAERGSALIVDSCQHHPATTFTMMSALPLADFVRIAERDLPLGIQILPKPFSATDLRAFLHEVLGQEPARQQS
jgi:DNA-binding response OmpR family regulator